MRVVSRPSPKKILLVGGVLVVAVAVIAGLELTNTTHIFHKTKKPVAVVSGSSFNTKGIPKKQGSSSQPTGQGGGSSDPSAPGGTKTTASSGTLITPFGNFVSNHHPNLSGSPAPNTISSVCNTAPGATCKITFSKDGVTKSLPPQTADGNGSTYWNWKLQDVGIGSGTWKIQAVASLGDQTKTASDTLDLEVSP